VNLSGHIYCDAPDCDANAYIGIDRFDATGKLTSLVPGWLTVTEHHTTEYATTTFAFCNGDCLMKWAASWSEPPTRIDGDEPAPSKEGE